MNKETFKINVFNTFNDCDPNFFDQVEVYKATLQKFNKQFNLTRLDSEEKIYSEYFYESIIPYKDIDFKEYINVLDIGSGSGIPGVVLKLLYPNINLTIIESNKKKCNFLEQLAKDLNIIIHVICKRAEEVSSNLREHFDLVTSRAVAILPIIVEISLPYTKLKGLTIIPKSQNVEKETKNINKWITKLGGEPNKIDRFVSINNKTHNVFIIRKVNKTPPTFPRMWKDIVKDFKDE